MAEVFLNSAAVGAGDGTSEADAYTDFETAVNGLTYGDTLWIKNSGTTYGITADGSAVDLSHLNVQGTSNVDLVKFIGYDSVTGDNPVGDNRPVITRTPNTHGSFYVRFPESAYVSNLRFDFEANTYQYNYPDEFRFGGGSEILNTKFTVRDPGTYMNPRSVPVVIYNGSLIQGCEFDYQVTTENTSTRDRYYLLSIGSVDNKWFDCVFKTASDINFMGNYTFGYQNEKMRGCIFVGNGNNSFFNIAYTNAHYWRSGYRITLDNCIFYNCGNAITVNAPTDTTTGSDTDVEWSNARGLVSVRNCMFENCLVGVDVPDYTDPSSWASGTFTMTHVVRVEKCGFYNNTTANTRGDMTEIETINLTASPFVDAANDDFAINEVAGGGKVIREQSGYEIPVFGGASVMKLFSGSVLEKDFSTTDTGSFDGRTGRVGDTITTSGRSFQLVQDNPRVWRRSGYTSSFSPSSISSLHSWYDASNATTITESGGVVTLWENANTAITNDLTPPVGNEPTLNTSNLNGRNTMSFTSTSWFNSDISTSSSTSTVIVLLKPATTSRWVMLNSGGAGYFVVSESGSVSTTISSNVGTPTYYINGAAANWTTRGDVYGDIGTNWSIVGGTDVDMSGLSIFSPNGFSGYRMTGDYAEILVFDQNLSQSDRQKVEGYLAHKWGLEGQLASNHPYRHRAP